MHLSDRECERPSLFKPLIFIAVLACLSIGTFLIVSQHYIKSLFDRIETSQRAGLVQIISIARNSMEPILKNVRSGAITREEAIRQIRPMIRSMTYNDEYGMNYIVMNSYDGINLVHPFEPSKELKSDYDLQDVNGLYIVRELLKAAKARPEGSFIRYYYYLPEVYGNQEKITYVIGIPEIQCYMATGMYMQRSIQEQKKIITKVKYAAIWLLLAVLIPISASVFVILNRNRRLIAEADIRRKAEEDLKKSEEKYRSIFENAMEGIFQTSEDGRLLSINPSFARIFGYESPGEMVSSVSSIIQHYADRSERNAFIKESNKKGFVENYLIRMKRKDGGLIWISNTSRAVKDGNGNILYYEGTLEDITRRKEAEENERKSRKLLNDILQAASEVSIVATDPDGIITSFNSGAELMLGYSADEMIGKQSVLVLHLESEMEKREKELSAEFGFPVNGFRIFSLRPAQNEPERHECTFVRKDGTSLSVSLVVTTVRSETNEITGYLGIACDMTDQRRLEEERQKLEQQLFHSRKMDAIGQLAGGVAHDFNNILMGVSGDASLMMMDCKTDHPFYQRLSRIEEHVKRGADVTSQLLGFARGGKYRLKPLSVNDLVRKSAMFFVETRREIGADFQLSEDISAVEADDGQIEQVLLNIYINAGHAMKNGGCIHISTGNLILKEADAKAFEVTPGDYVNISITDTGIGMDEETLKRVFEPFFTTKSETGGSGLGLASAYGIIRNHGGVITALSKLGEGSTFSIYLPASRKKIERDKAKPVKTLFTGKGGILIIDDEPALLGLASEVLIMLGYKVYKAEAGQEAVSIYNDNQDSIDLVILDMILRGASGASVLKMLKDVNPDVRVILSSGYGLQGEVQKVMQMGCMGFIQKPYSFAELSSIVHKVMEDKKKINN